MKNNFIKELSNLYKNIQKNISNEYDVILLPKNPYLIENANILISSYKKIILILYLTKKEISDYEYLLYRIYLLRLAYPLEANIILYSKDIHMHKINKIEKMEQVRLFDSEKELTHYLSKNFQEENMNFNTFKNINRIKHENFYRSNLIFFSTYNRINTIKNAKSYQELEAKYKNTEFITLKNRRIKKFKYFIKESLIAVENFKYIKNLKILSFYSFINNFDFTEDYIRFSNKTLPNCVLFDNFEENNKVKFLNSLSFNNLYLSNVSYDEDFTSTYYKFGSHYNDRIYKYRKYNETKNKKY